MESVKEVISGISKFLYVSLLFDLLIFLVVSAFCLVITDCNGSQWSEYMFWLSMLAMIGAMPAILASMNTSRGYFDNPYTAGADLAVASTIIKSERRGLNKRTAFMLRMLSIGIMGIVISAVIEILTRNSI